MTIITRCKACDRITSDCILHDGVDGVRVERTRFRCKWCTRGKPPKGHGQTFPTVGVRFFQAKKHKPYYQHWTT